MQYQYKIIAFLCFFAKKRPKLCRQIPLSCKQKKGSPQGTALLRNINNRGDLIYFFFLAMTTAAPLRSARANAPPA
ncbi:hypothetical protein, partial [Ruminococcus sp. N15.MGS-57]|uniref:hypothetical protein n=1 Tax=Ruminococcus sp. N15.MGS-57 TaxID=1637508 RepID=UPI002D7F59F3